MLNKKKQIILAKKIDNVNSSTLFNLPDYPKSYFVQTTEVNNLEIETLNLIFEKDFSKKVTSEKSCDQFRYFLQNKVFVKYFYLKNFLKKQRFLAKNFRSSFVFLRQIFKKGYRYPRLFKGANKGGFKSFSFGFLCFMPKSCTFKNEKKNKNQQILKIKLIIKRRKLYKKRKNNFNPLRVIKRSKRSINLNIVCSIKEKRVR